MVNIQSGQFYLITLFYILSSFTYRGNMNAKEAVKILRREGYDVEKEGKLYWVTYEGRAWYDKPITAREMIKQAKIYTSENNQNTAMKKKLKHFRHRNNRAKTRENLDTENYDAFPQGKLAKDEDPWNWD